MPNKPPTTPPPYRPNNQQGQPQQPPQWKPTHGQPTQGNTANMPNTAYGQQGQTPYQQQGQTPYQQQGQPQQWQRQHQPIHPQKKGGSTKKGIGLGCLISFGLFMLLGIIGTILDDEPEKTGTTSTQQLANIGDSNRQRAYADSARHLTADSAGLALNGEETRPVPHPDRVWTIDDVPMAHLEHRSEYVSDPDGYLTTSEKALADSFLYMMEHGQNCESAFIVVGHVPDKNAHRFAIDLGKKYGIGTAETHRGVTVVIAVEDKKFSIATTQGIQEELTDQRCGRISDQFIIPNMKAGDTGGAVIETSQALYYQLAEGTPHLADGSGISRNYGLMGSSKPAEKTKTETDMWSIIGGIIVLGFIIWWFRKMKLFSGGGGSGSGGTSSYSGSYSSNDDDDDDDDYDSSSSYSSSDSGSYSGGGSYDGGGSSGGW